MANEYIDAVLLIDMSDSMTFMTKSVINGFNSILQCLQRLNNTVYITAVLVNTDYTVFQDHIDSQNVSFLTGEEYKPGGEMALLDALGETIRRIEDIQRFSPDDTEPSETLFVMVIDKKENASRFFSYESVREMITRTQQERKWEFLFCGTDIGTRQLAVRLGIDRRNGFICDSCETGMSMIYAALEKEIRRRIYNAANRGKQDRT